MIRTFFRTSVQMTDILDPTPDELQKIAKDYQIHETFIVDILQPEHLPNTNRRQYAPFISYNTIQQMITLSLIRSRENQQDCRIPDRLLVITYS